MTIHLEPLQADHFDRLHQLFDAVCRERRFMAYTQAPPQDQTLAYYRAVVAAGHTHFVAVQGDAVLGWCDVLPLAGQMRAHAGVLGIGVAASARGRGVGRQLIRAAISGARQRGLSRIELTVHADNRVAQALYRQVGFELEGTQRRAWCLDGVYFDVLHMARNDTAGAAQA